jgi:hypothetical protein
MNEKSLYIISSIVMIIAMILVAIMYYYKMSETSAFSFTLGVGLVATGIEEKIDKPRSLLFPYSCWVFALSNFIIGCTKL